MFDTRCPALWTPVAKWFRKIFYWIDRHSIDRPIRYRKMIIMNIINDNYDNYDIYRTDHSLTTILPPVGRIPYRVVGE